MESYPGQRRATLGWFKVSAKEYIPVYVKEMLDVSSANLARFSADSAFRPLANGGEVFNVKVQGQPNRREERDKIPFDNTTLLGKNAKVAEEALEKAWRRYEEEAKLKGQQLSKLESLDLYISQWKVEFAKSLDQLLATSRRASEPLEAFIGALKAVYVTPMSRKTKDSSDVKYILMNEDWKSSVLLMIENLALNIGIEVKDSELTKKNAYSQVMRVMEANCGQEAKKLFLEKYGSSLPTEGDQSEEDYVQLLNSWKDYFRFLANCPRALAAGAVVAQVQDSMDGDDESSSSVLVLQSGQAAVAPFRGGGRGGGSVAGRGGFRPGLVNPMAGPVAAFPGGQGRGRGGRTVTFTGPNDLEVNFRKSTCGGSCAFLGSCLTLARQGRSGCKEEPTQGDFEKSKCNSYLESGVCSKGEGCTYIHYSEKVSAKFYQSQQAAAAARAIIEQNKAFPAATTRESRFPQPQQAPFTGVTPEVRMAPWFPQQQFQQQFSMGGFIPRYPRGGFGGRGGMGGGRGAVDTRTWLCEPCFRFPDSGKVCKANGCPNFRQ